VIDTWSNSIPRFRSHHDNYRNDLQAVDQSHSGNSLVQSVLVLVLELALEGAGLARFPVAQAEEQLSEHGGENLEEEEYEAIRF